MTLGVLLLWIIALGIILNVITVFVRLKLNKKAIDTDGGYFAASLMLSGLTLVIIFIYLLDKYGDAIVKLLNIKVL